MLNRGTGLIIMSMNMTLLKHQKQKKIRKENHVLNGKIPWTRAQYSDSVGFPNLVHL